MAKKVTIRSTPTTVDVYVGKDFHFSDDVQGIITGADLEKILEAAGVKSDYAFTEKGCECSDCHDFVEPEGRYFSTYCGTFCDLHGEAHMDECGVCRREGF